jgi:UDPglucose 6-dehydrogenase
MKIVVVGLWHLGCTVAACCARRHDVVGLDSDAQNIARLQQGKAPLFEPGLDDLLSAGLAKKSLSFTTDPVEACDQADLLWVCFDTPVNENDQSDVASVLERLRRALSALPPRAVVLVSSQLPVGTCRKLEAEFPRLYFACSPENLRLGKAIEAFEKAERVIVGMRDDTCKALFENLFRPYTAQVLFLRTESAEMVKHALNSFLALSIAFINEIARLCEQTGADAREVAAGLKSDVRIGQRSYLNPGGPFAGGTLARDVVALSNLALEKRVAVALIPAIKQSNDEHRGWMLGRLKDRLGELRGRNIAVLGLTYKPGTDTLRRSVAVELCRQLIAAGATVRAWDPVVKQLPAELGGAALVPGLAAALADADAAAICTEWPEFRQAPWAEAILTMRRPLVIDANRFLERELKELTGIEHLSVGQAL